MTWTSTDQRIDIVKEQVHLTLFVGKTAATLNDESVQLSTAPFNDNGITYVPLKFVSEAMDMQLIWDKDSASVKINQGKFRPPYLSSTKERIPTTASRS